MRRIAPGVLAALVLLAGCDDVDDAAPPTERSADTVPAPVDSAPATDDTGATAHDAGDTRAAADVVRAYYDAIAAGRHRDAWLMWSDSGAASGQTFEAFASGFGATADVDVQIGTPGRIEGAAGSRYVELPVVVRAVTTDGTRQRFEGSYTLRRSVVDGATAEQRAWRIHSAALREIE